jgi:hypothetical protein
MAYVAGGFFGIALMWPIGHLVFQLMIKAGIEGGDTYHSVGTPESRRAIFKRQVDDFESVARPVAVVCAVIGLVLIAIALTRK